MDATKTDDSNMSWAIIDSVSIPCLKRRGVEFVPVKLVEQDLLCRFPNEMDIAAVRPLVGYHMTETESMILNRNLDKTDDQFRKNDVLVSLEDCLDFYNKAKAEFDKTPATGGWVQLNNTVIPYVIRETSKLVPIDIIRYGAQLLNDCNLEEFELEGFQWEREYLNRSLQMNNFNYALQPSSKLIDLAVVWMECKEKPNVAELPGTDPMSHAKHYDDVATDVTLAPSAVSEDAGLTEIVDLDKVTPIIISPRTDEPLDVDNFEPSLCLSDSQVESSHGNHKSRLIENANPQPERNPQESVSPQKYQSGKMKRAATESSEILHSRPNKMSRVEIEPKNATTPPSSVDGITAPSEGTKGNADKPISAANDNTVLPNSSSVESETAMCHSSTLIGTSSSESATNAYSLVTSCAAATSLTTDGVFYSSSDSSVDLQLQHRSDTRNQAGENVSPLKKTGDSPYQDISAIKSSTDSLKRLLAKDNTATSNNAVNASTSALIGALSLSCAANTLNAVDSSRETSNVVGSLSNSTAGPQLQHGVINKLIAIANNPFGCISTAAGHASVLTEGFNRLSDVRAQYSIPTCPPPFYGQQEVSSNQFGFKPITPRSTHLTSSGIGDMMYNYRQQLFGSTQCASRLPNNPHISADNQGLDYRKSTAARQEGPNDPSVRRNPYPQSYAGCPSATAQYAGATFAAVPRQFIPGQEGGIKSNLLFNSGFIPTHSKPAVMSGKSEAVSFLSDQSLPSSQHRESAVPSSCDRTLKHQSNPGSLANRCNLSEGEVCRFYSRTRTSIQNNSLGRNNSNSQSMSGVASKVIPNLFDMRGPAVVYPKLMTGQRMSYHPTAIGRQCADVSCTSANTGLMGQFMLNPVLQTGTPSLAMNASSMTLPPESKSSRMMELPSNCETRPPQQHHPSNKQYLNSLVVSQVNEILYKHNVRQVQADGGNFDASRTSRQPTAAIRRQKPRRLDYETTKPWIRVALLPSGTNVVSVSFCGKRVSCLLKHGVLYSPLESLHLLFFGSRSLESWLYALEVNCAASTIRLTTAEERFFIGHFKIPVKELRCNRAISLDEFVTHLPLLQAR